MKYVYIIILLFTYPSFAQNRSQPSVQIDSTFYQTQRIVLRLDSLEKRLSKFTATKDSLVKELYYYRQKEDLYIGLFDRYGGRTDTILSIFVGIVGIALPLLGFISLRKINNKINKISIIDKRLEAEEERFNESLANVYSNISIVLYGQQALLDEEDGLDQILLKIQFIWEAIECALRTYYLQDENDQNIRPILLSAVPSLSELITLIDKDEYIEFLEGESKPLPPWLNSYQETIVDLTGFENLSVQKEANRLNEAILALRSALVDKYPAK